MRYGWKTWIKSENEKKKTASWKKLVIPAPDGQCNKSTLALSVKEIDLGHTTQHDVIQQTDGSGTHIHAWTGQTSGCQFLFGWSSSKRVIQFRKARHTGNVT